MLMVIGEGCTVAPVFPPPPGLDIDIGGLPITTKRTPRMVSSTVRETDWLKAFLSALRFD
jgi:hypothetical protein